MAIMELQRAATKKEEQFHHDGAGAGIEGAIIPAMQLNPQINKQGHQTHHGQTIPLFLLV
jgi:hypothetical protein